MNRLFFSLLLCCTGFIAVGCGPRTSENPTSQLSTPSAGEPAKLTLTGSSTIAPLAAEIAKRFEELHPELRIDVQTGGSSRGIRDSRSGGADLGMASRPLKSEEHEGLTAHLIGWDGVTFVVHKNNPITELSREQLISIYTGGVDNWRDLGGLDAPIIVSNRAEGRSELDLMTDYLGIEATQIEADVIDGETQQTIKTVTTNANVITYTSVGAAQFAVDHGEPLKLLPLGGIAASMTTVQAGEFPLARPLLLISPDAGTKPWVERFLSYAGSSDVDDLTQSLGYVPPNRDGQRES